MAAAARQPAHCLWCDSEGTHLALFCWVEQVTQDSQPAQLHQRGQVLGRGLDVLYVSFEGSHQLVSVAPWLLRWLRDTPGGC